MSTQPISLFSSSSSAKITVVSTDSGIGSSSSAATADPSSFPEAANPRRKVGSNFERAFEQSANAGPSTSGSSGSRTVLKASKAVSSAPPAGPNRPLTQLEEAFADRSIQDQRWLLSFPLAMKQLYFSYAESSNHDQILTGLITRFPELLAGGERSPPAIRVAIENGNWNPAMKFVSACAAGIHIKLLRQRGENNRTYPMQVMVRLIELLKPTDEDQTQIELASQLICSMFKACPDLLTSMDDNGQNPIHYCALHCGSREAVFRPILKAIRNLCGQQPTQELPRHLGNALVAKDANGHRPDEVGSDNESCRIVLQDLQNEFPEFTYDHPMPPDPAAGVLAREHLKSSLNERGKSSEFIDKISQLIKDPRIILVPKMQNPVESVLDWFKNSHKSELRTALQEIGAPDLCSDVDSLC